MDLAWQWADAVYFAATTPGERKVCE